MIAQDELVGTRFEKCVVESLIGRGGYGLTFLAFDEELREHRVIKVSQDAGMDETMRRRHLKTFLDEGLILSRLKHPQIVTLRGQGEKNGHRYMILDYIRGFNIRNIIDIIQQRQQELACEWQDLLDPETASALVLSALYPMEYAHRANVHLPDREIFGVAHRDISPGNLILGVQGNEKGRIVLIDFGTAKTDLTESITIDQNLVGTVPYMSKVRLQKTSSPEEMALNQEFWKGFRETQHDIHALGVLYFQLLTGRLPFSGETSPQIIVKILDPKYYSQCHLEIARSHPFASDLLQKSLVYHDFSTPIKDQPYQYPDAGRMLPDMVRVFDKLSRGHSAQEILVELGKKLAQPELFIPVQNNVAFTFPATTKMQETRLTKESKRLLWRMDLLKPTTRVAVYAAVLLCAIALALTASQSFQSSAKKSSSEAAILPPSKLEKLTNSTDIVANPKRSQNGDSPNAESRVHTPIVAISKPKNTAQSAATLTQGIKRQDSSSTQARLDKDVFVQLQGLFREQDPSAYDQIVSWLNKFPESADLRFLKVQLVLSGNPLAEDIRPELVGLQNVQPEFTHPSLFHQSVQYLLFELDANVYQSQKTPVKRVNMQKSANAYLAEYQDNPAFSEKVKHIKALLAK